MSEQAVGRNNAIFWLLFITLVAIYLRTCGLSYGLPYILGLNEAEIFKNIFNAFHFNLSGILLVLREICLVLSVLTIIILYLISIRFGPLVAIISSFLLSISFLHVSYSSIFNLTIISLFFSMFATYFALRAYENYTPSFRNYLKTSFTFAFLSLLTSFLGIISLVPGTVVSFMKKETKRLKKLFLVSAFLFLLLNIPVFYDNFSGFQQKVNSFFIYLRLLLQALGPVAFVLIFILPFFWKWQDKRLLAIIFSVPLLSFAILSFLNFKKIEYVLFLLPYACLAAAHSFICLLKGFNTYSELKKFLFILLTLFGIWIPLKSTLNYNQLVKLPDTRVLATEWILRKTSKQYTVAWDENSLLIKGKTNSYEKFDLIPKGQSYRKRLVISDDFLKQKKWFSILRKKADFVVVNNIDIEKALRTDKNKLKRKFYKKLLSTEPEVVFNPYLKGYENKLHLLLFEDLYFPYETLWARERFGPLIKIYKI